MLKKLGRLPMQQGKPSQAKPHIFQSYLLTLNSTTKILYYISMLKAYNILQNIFTDSQLSILVSLPE